MQKPMMLQRREFLKISAIAGLTLTSRSRARAADGGLPRFAVMSDTHFNMKNGSVQKVSRSLKNIVSKGNLDALFVVGDLTDNGQAEQYDVLLKVFKDENIIPQSQRVVFMMGNHEYYNKENPVENYAKLGQPLHQFIDIKGFPFITVSINGGGDNSYNAESQKFLSGSLAEAAKKYPNKPVFVFAHIPPKNTCYGSKSWGTDNFYPFLHEYPQVVFFSGHTHTPVGDPRMIWQNTFTSINDGSNAYVCVEHNEVDDGVSLRGGHNTTEALIVNVQQGSMLDIERWDTRHNEEMPRWNVDWKNKNYKNRDGKPAPEFPAGAVPAVKVAGKECTVTFPQAKDDEIVFRYIVEIKEGGKTAATAKPSSRFYLNSEMPKEISVVFKTLPAEIPLTAEVRALDSFGNSSPAIASSVVTV
jgi:Icc-related predicted phosphoesterase